MDWRSVRFDWNQARAFLVTAEEGSLSAAARALGLTQPTVGRQVAALEAELGLVLFERVGRGLALTPNGRALVEHVRAMGDGATRVSLAASGHSQAVAGNVSITASDLFSATILPPIVAELRRRAPAISVEIVAANTLQDLLRREADVAIRHVAPQHGELIGRRVRDFNARLYATPEYLAQLGHPTRPEQLRGAVFFGHDSGAVNTAAWLNQALGLGLTEGNFQVVSENGVVVRELMGQGLGIGILPEMLGDADPRLARVAVDLPPVPIPVWLVTHRELRHSARIRLVYDLLGEGLQRV